ncbi:MAG: hypothetical protein K9M49_03470 [Candidatus Marinimicrobia bacterium]|nr:hypothetical protein [Candidatus Neomarinimicrobiota bacterium]MCF7851360.1 hypothetical protein [Candidatus Neomarinimicrobiota bacterium]MCF7904194.1 hypothetical protein [Candidatus Neomarinimicrobiota bacterium]
MRRCVILIMTLLIIVSVACAQGLKPYILGAVSEEPLDIAKTYTRAHLDSAGFEILGEYAPAGDYDRWVIVITDPEIIAAVENFGGLRGFAAAIRVALTEENGKVNITYTNPLYLGNAYFQDDYQEVAHHWIFVNRKLDDMMRKLGVVDGRSFGAKVGMSAKEVRKYHYMFGMEYFEDVVELKEFPSFTVGKNTIEAELEKGGTTDLVYAVEIPGQDLKLYGIALNGSEGESHFLPIIDIATPKHTAFLPYEILLMGDTAVMLHGRYRIALSFPDLTMTTFGKIMSTPGDIQDLMESVTE